MSIKTSFSNLCAVLKEMLDGKVDKVSGKGLSTNDFTTAYKTKLDGIAAEANKITVDSALSGTSTNPVQNKVVAERIGTIEANVSSATTTAENAAASAAAVKKTLQITIRKQKLILRLKSIIKYRLFRSLVLQFVKHSQIRTFQKLLFISSKVQKKKQTTCMMNTYMSTQSGKSLALRL